MEIKVGFEISYYAVNPTPMVTMLNIHPSRFADIVGTETVIAEPNAPSAGWIEFDPTNGIVGSRDLIRVAVARDPRQAVPLHGTYMGPPDAFVGMDVSINVVSASEDAKA